jgi:hypothetical protein
VSDMDELDLSSFSYQEFVTFFFDRPAPEPDEHAGSFAAEGAECAWSRPEVAVGYMTKLFRNFPEIRREYSLGQVNQAIWMIIGLDFNLVENLWDNSVALSDRIECIRSMYFVYSDFVAKSDVAIMENCFDMWWDLLGTSFWLQTNFFYRSELQKGKALRRVNEGEVAKLDSSSRALLDAMFETLQRILQLPDLRTQKYALHGLGHLHHPAVRELVQKHIDDHRDEFTEDGLKWVERCRDGKVM